MRKRVKGLAQMLLMASMIAVTSIGIWGQAVMAQQAPELTTKRDPDRERARLQKAIIHELVMLPYYGVFDNLAFKLDGYEVELVGQVTRPTLKTDAERVVKDIEGVERVVNNIEVLPLSPHDDRLRWAVYRAIYFFPPLQRYAIRAVPPIHIIVKAGRVTLEGVVATASDRNLAEIRAKGVSGVFAVTNKLQVEKK